MHRAQANNVSMLCDSLSSGHFYNRSPQSAEPWQARVSWRLQERLLQKQHATQRAHLKNAHCCASLSRGRGLTNWRDPLFLLYAATSQWTKIGLLSIWKVGCKYFFQTELCLQTLLMANEHSISADSHCLWCLAAALPSCKPRDGAAEHGCYDKVRWYELGWKVLWSVASQALHCELFGRQSC